MSKLPKEKLDVRLIALDLDDTLLNSETQISDDNVDALRRAAALGIYVVICSGRAEDAILPYVRRLDIAGMQAGRYIIAVNGSSVFDLHMRRQIYKRVVGGEILRRADSIAAEFGLVSEVYDPDVIHTSKETEWTRRDSELCHIRLNVVEDWQNFLDKGFVKMLIPGEPELLLKVQDKLKAELGDRAVVFLSKPYFLEVLPPNCGKGEAIQFLAQHIGIPQNTTMGFGDSMNDESMLRMCGYGVAMQNGLDYIKDIATFVTEKDNNASGIGDFVRKYVL